jgi:hypothetical protein
MDQSGVWRVVHVNDNWMIPNETRVKEFETEQQARKFAKRTADRMLWQQTDKRNG